MRVLKKQSSITRFFAKALNKLFVETNRLRHFARYSMLANSLRHFGSNVRFDDNVHINQPHNVIINNDVFIGRDTIIHAYDLITIGNHTVIAAGCKLISANHRFDDIETPINYQGHDCKPIQIGDDVWLGYGVVILPGVCLGTGCVVAAGAVVSKSFEPYSVIAGVPAKLIRHRRSPEGVH